MHLLRSIARNMHTFTFKNKNRKCVCPKRVVSTLYVLNCLKVNYFMLYTSCGGLIPPILGWSNLCTKIQCRNERSSRGFSLVISIRASVSPAPGIRLCMFLGSAFRCTFGLFYGSPLDLTPFRTTLQPTSSPKPPQAAHSKYYLGLNNRLTFFSFSTHLCWL
jgi:hypothetical protein